MLLASAARLSTPSTCSTRASPVRERRAGGERPALRLGTLLAIIAGSSSSSSSGGGGSGKTVSSRRAAVAACCSGLKQLEDSGWWLAGAC